MDRLLRSLSFYKFVSIHPAETKYFNLSTDMRYIERGSHSYSIPAGGYLTQNSGKSAQYYLRWLKYNITHNMSRIIIITGEIVSSISPKHVRILSRMSEIWQYVHAMFGFQKEIHTYCSLIRNMNQVCM